MSLKTLNFISSQKCHIKNYQVLSRRKHQKEMCQGYRHKHTNNSLSPKHILSPTTRESFLNNINALKPISTKLSPEIKKAAVLIPLCEINKEMVFLYTVRAMHLKANGGEVSFPGGMCDASDNTLEGTALREAYEEIGIPSKEVDVWGRIPEINRKNLCVTPILGHIKNFKLENLKINYDEVSMVFPVTLKHLISAANIKYTQFRFGKTTTLKTPVYINCERKIWGLTGYITHLVLSSLLPDHYLKNIQFKSSFQKILTAQPK